MQWYCIFTIPILMLHKGRIGDSANPLQMPWKFALKPSCLLTLLYYLLCHYFEQDSEFLLFRQIFCLLNHGSQPSHTCPSQTSSAQSDPALLTWTPHSATGATTRPIMLFKCSYWKPRADSASVENLALAMNFVNEFLSHLSVWITKSLEARDARFIALYPSFCTVVTL